MSMRDKQPPLQLDSETMRQFGYAVVDALIADREGLPERAPVNRATRPEMEKLFREALPEQGSPPQEVLARVHNQIQEHCMPLDHPRFFGWVPGPTNFISVMAEALTAGLNPFMGSWLVSAAPSQIELVTVDWLRQWIGLPEGSGGLFVSGGSMANLTALAAARAAREHEGHNPRWTVYLSAQTHSSIERALRVLGFSQEQVRSVATDSSDRICMDSLREAIETDQRNGLQPLAVVANAGTTNTGAVDPLAEIASLCQKEKIWFHIDGAYGAPAVALADQAERFRGIEQADSVTLDPHKWLFQPYETGCLLVRRPEDLRRAFSIFRDYMRDAVGPDDEINFRDYGVQLTRSFRALKVWMSLQTFGAKAFRDAIAHGIDLAEQAERWVANTAGWHAVTPARLGLFTFRHVPEGMSAAQIDQHNERLTKAIYNRSVAVMSSTEVAGRPVQRLCTINPRSTGDDLRSVLTSVDQIANEIADEA